MTTSHRLPCGGCQEAAGDYTTKLAQCLHVFLFPAIVHVALLQAGLLRALETDFAELAAYDWLKAQ